MRARALPEQALRHRLTGNGLIALLSTTSQWCSNASMYIFDFDPLDSVFRSVWFYEGLGSMQ